MQSNYRFITNGSWKSPYFGWLFIWTILGIFISWNIHVGGYYSSSPRKTVNSTTYIHMTIHPAMLVTWHNHIKCDPAWENRAYVHIKFDHIYNKIFTNSAANNGLFTAIYRLCISCTEGKISRIIWRGGFCVHKLYFLMPGHKYTNILWSITQ